MEGHSTTDCFKNSNRAGTEEAATLQTQQRLSHKSSKCMDHAPYLKEEGWEEGGGDGGESSKLYNLPKPNMSHLKHCTHKQKNSFPQPGWMMEVCGGAYSQKTRMPSDAALVGGIYLSVLNKATSCPQSHSCKTNYTNVRAFKKNELFCRNLATSTVLVLQLLTLTFLQNVSICLKQA